MADNVKTPSIYVPKTLGDLIADKGKNPSLVIFAGGTYIMSRPGIYPEGTGNDIISIMGIPELQKVTHTDRFIEVGAAVTLDQLLNTGSFLFSKDTFAAIENIGTSVIRSRATVGGSLCTQDMRFFLSVILTTIGAQAEIRLIQKKGFGRVVTKQNWYPVRKLYSPSGEFLFKDDALLTKIRIPASENSVQVFRIVGSPMRKPSETVYFGLSYTPSQNGIVQPNLCIAYPRNGFYNNQDVNSNLSSLSMPADNNAIEEQKEALRQSLEEYCPDITDSQKNRTLRLFTHVLQDISQQFMTLV